MVLFFLAVWAVAPIIRNWFRSTAWDWMGI